MVVCFPLVFCFPIDSKKDVVRAFSFPLGFNVVWDFHRCLHGCHDVLRQINSSSLLSFLDFYALYQGIVTLLTGKDY